MLQIESNFKHGSQNLRVAVWTSTYYSAVGRFWHLMRTKCSHCSNLSFLIPSRNVLVMSKNYLKIPSNSVLHDRHLISTIDRLPSDLTVQHHVCVAGIRVLCAILAVVQKRKLATVARTRNAQPSITPVYEWMLQFFEAQIWVRPYHWLHPFYLYIRKCIRTASQLTKSNRLSYKGLLVTKVCGASLIVLWIHTSVGCRFISANLKNYISKLMRLWDCILNFYHNNSSSFLFRLTNFVDI